MSDLEDGQSTQVEGSRGNRYTITNTGGVYSCSCPAWRNQSLPIEKRTCKHIRRLRGDDAETERLGSAGLLSGVRRKIEKGESADEGEQAPKLLLAHKWEMDVDLTGWWMSEKLDGIRAYWDGTQMISRLGNRFVPPDWFVEQLPKTPLDGELWGGRKQFQRTTGIVKRQDKSEKWREIKYLVFDAPAHEGTFEDRIDWLDRSLRSVADHVAVLEHAVCNGEAHLKEELARVEALGGEGLMLRKPGSRYVAGRSDTLLKVKSFFDAEARVLDHVAGTGRHRGRLGSLLVELPNGTRFNVGTGFSDAQREAPPAAGTIVTFRYQELTNAGVPRFPVFVGERHDFDWAKSATAPLPVRRAGGSESEAARERSRTRAVAEKRAKRLPRPPTAAPTAKKSAVKKSAAKKSAAKKSAAKKSAGGKKRR
jgi:DNA ligase-1